MKTKIYLSRKPDLKPFAALEILLDPGETIDVARVLHDARRMRTMGKSLECVFISQFTDVEDISAENAFAMGAIADEGLTVMLPSEAAASLEALDDEV